MSQPPASYADSTFNSLPSHSNLLGNSPQPYEHSNSSIGGVRTNPWDYNGHQESSMAHRDLDPWNSVEQVRATLQNPSPITENYALPPMARSSAVHTQSSLSLSQQAYFTGQTTWHPYSAEARYGANWNNVHQIQARVQRTNPTGSSYRFSATQNPVLRSRDSSSRENLHAPGPQRTAWQGVSFQQRKPRVGPHPLSQSYTVPYATQAEAIVKDSLLTNHRTGQSEASKKAVNDFALPDIPVGKKAPNVFPFAQHAAGDDLFGNGLSLPRPESFDTDWMAWKLSRLRKHDHDAWIKGCSNMPNSPEGTLTASMAEICLPTLQEQYYQGDSPAGSPLPFTKHNLNVLTATPRPASMLKSYARSVFGAQRNALKVVLIKTQFWLAIYLRQLEKHMKRVKEFIVAGLEDCFIEHDDGIIIFKWPDSSPRIRPSVGKDEHVSRIPNTAKPESAVNAEPSSSPTEPLSSPLAHKGSRKDNEILDKVSLYEAAGAESRSSQTPDTSRSPHSEPIHPSPNNTLSANTEGTAQRRREMMALDAEKINVHNIRQINARLLLDCHKVRARVSHALNQMEEDIHKAGSVKDGANVPRSRKLRAEKPVNLDFTNAAQVLAHYKREKILLQNLGIHVMRREKEIREDHGRLISYMQLLCGGILPFQD